MDVKDNENFVIAAAAFEAYGRNARRDIVESKEQRVAALPPEQQRLANALVIPHSSRVAACIEANAELATHIAHSVPNFIHGVDPDRVTAVAEETRKWDQVRVVLNQLAREWSKAGAQERRESYGPVIEALMREFPIAKDVKVLVPGCGLGRLPWELATRGYSAAGNENSCEMLITQHFMLTEVDSSPCEDTIYPSVHAMSHFWNPADQLHPVQVPNVEDSTAMAEKQNPGELTILCGDFNESFDNYADGHFDAIASVFFLDTQSNIFETVQVATRVVRTGGIWINFGPLHWHFERVGPRESDEGGLELTGSGLIKLIEMHGWRLESHKSHQKATYCATNPNRLSPYVYDCEFWIARKVK